jgi:hypothetical protein
MYAVLQYRLGMACRNALSKKQVVVIFEHVFVLRIDQIKGLTRFGEWQ